MSGNMNMSPYEESKYSRQINNTYAPINKKTVFPNNSDNNFYKAARLIDEVEDPNNFAGGSSWNAVIFYPLF